MVMGLIVLVVLLAVVGWAFRRAGRWSRSGSAAGSSGAWMATGGGGYGGGGYGGGDFGGGGCDGGGGGC